MPQTRKPKERAEILDELLAHGSWTGKELFRRLNEKLEDLDEKSIDTRTFKRDLDYLESKDAPLHRPSKGEMVYFYTESFSLKNVPLDSDEVNALKKAINILKRVENFQMTDELDLIIGKLENRIHTNIPDNQTVVHFENHTNALGSQWFNNLFDAVREQTALEITYHSFKYSESKEFTIHPYLLKEYRNRWFLLGRNGNEKRIMTLGLDRIKKIKMSKQKFVINDLLDPDTYFNKVIGVSIDYDKQPEEIILKIYPVSVQHVESKPIHKDQEIVNKEKDGSLIIRLNLMINYELKAVIMGFGDGIEVMEPASLRRDIQFACETIVSRYQK